MPQRRFRTRRQALRRSAAVAATAMAAAGLAACGSSADTAANGAPILNWYVNPNSSGSLQKIATACEQSSGGKYKISIQVLPATADGQREQIVRRLAADDPSVDVVNVDPPYMPELANAGWLESYTPAQQAVLLKDVLKAPIQTAMWQGKLFGVPWVANTQLLWYRKSVAQKAGVDPTAPDFTWDKMLAAALKTNTIIAEQGKRYEGYMVWVNAMILSAGGQILENTNAGRDATVAINSPESKRAAEIIRSVATSAAADPALNVADEEAGRATFQGPKGGFMLNWPYVWAAFHTAVDTKVMTQQTLEDIAWARYPKVDADKPVKPPSGGINMAIGKFSLHKTEAFDFLKCAISPEMEKINMTVNGDPMANGTIYTDPAVLKIFPKSMALLIRDSINTAGPRPISPFYGDVTGAIQLTWHPPARINPDTTPAASAELISGVLHDQRLL